MRRAGPPLPHAPGMTCSTPVILGAIGGAALGVVMTLGHPSYPDQVVVSLATVGANLASRRAGSGVPSLGDVVVLTVLLMLTLSIAGWHLAGLTGLLAGVILGSLITRVRFRSR
ncbi:MAG: hypothetical protein QOH15_3185 [Gaiellales bacterium]|jgi:hypothetical protein|nr:hypothetical protein [Gaiellales bacterium]